MEACTRGEHENGCVAGHLWDSIHPDRIHYVEERYKVEVSDEGNMLGSQHNRIIRDWTAGI